jgi:FkbM family methyltransferase
VRYLKRGIATRCTKLLRDYLKDGLISVPQGAVVINFGANIGEAAIALERRGACVLAIEPDPNVLPALRANACGRQIEVIPYVAWHTDGAVPLYLATKKGDTSVINPSDQCINATAKRLDAIVRERCLEEVYLILGDAEGGEPEVLEGAAETLKITRYVSIRVSPERRGSSSAPQCMAILEAAGFDILSDDNETLIGRNRALACG